MSSSRGSEPSLVEFLAEFAERPYDFAIACFPWGEAGTDLEHRKGPVAWQKKVLIDIQTEYQRSRENGRAALAVALGEAYQAAIRSGHGIGKSALLSILMLWAVSTRDDTRGRVTANTERQLRTTLWPELAKWFRLFIGRELFVYTSTSLYSADPEHEKNWRIDAIPWSEDNTEAFAGLHNYGKRVIVLFDEASAISDKIWETTDGVMHEADTDLIWIATGNPTRNYGRFYECFHRFASEWHTYRVDSREVPFANKEKISRAIELYGEDSDYVKVRYLGEFPSSSSSQLIPTETIESGMARPVQSFHYEPLILSVDIARFGKNESVALYRRGKDARTIPAQRWRGLSVIETGNRIAAMIAKDSPDAVFIDEGGVGGGVVDFVRHLGHSVIGVNYGAKASSRPGGVLVANKRAEMYVQLRDWLREGGCIESSSDLRDQLVVIEYYFNAKQEIILVSKEDMEAEGVASPDWADALAQSFAYPVASRSAFASRPRIAVDYDPMDWKQAMSWNQEVVH